MKQARSRATAFSQRSLEQTVNQKARQGTDLLRRDAQVYSSYVALDRQKQAHARWRALFGEGAFRSENAQYRIRSQLARKTQLLQRAREDAIMRARTNILHRATEARVSCHAAHRGDFNGKPAFLIKDTLEDRIIDLECMKHLRKRLIIKPGSRSSIGNSLYEVLSRRNGMHCFRTDIQGYFESISHANLKKQLRNDRLLDPVVRLFIESTLDFYRKTTKRTSGIPRGVGLSSAIADYYLLGVDEVLAQHPSVIYYVRYVDDILIVTENEDGMAGVKKVLDAMLATLKLTLNEMKSDTIPLRPIGDASEGREQSITFLGVKYVRNHARLRVEVDISDARKARLEKRIDIAFQLWLRQKKKAGAANTGIDGLLLQRVQYITGMTSIDTPDRRHIAIGVQRSHRRLSPNAANIKLLDTYLRECIRQHTSSLMPHDLRARLRACTFSESLSRGKFRRFSPAQIAQVTSCWRSM